MNIFIDLLFANGHNDAPPLGGVQGVLLTRARRKKRGLLTSALCVCVCSFSNETAKYNTLKDARKAVFPCILFVPLLYIALFSMPLQR